MAVQVGKQPTSILVVEDHKLVRGVANKILTNERFHVVEAHDAQEALALLEERSDIQIVFTDWNMPGSLDGSGLAHLVSKRWPEISIIVTSGMMRPYLGDLPRGTRFIPKPYWPTALIEELKKVASERSEVERDASVLSEGDHHAEPRHGKR